MTSTFLISFLTPWISRFLRWSCHSESYIPSKILKHSDGLFTLKWPPHAWPLAPQKGIISSPYPTAFLTSIHSSHHPIITSLYIPATMIRFSIISHSITPCLFDGLLNPSVTLLHPINSPWMIIKRHHSWPEEERPDRCCRVSIFGVHVLLLSCSSFGIQESAL